MFLFGPRHLLLLSMLMMKLLQLLILLQDDFQTDNIQRKICGHSPFSTIRGGKAKNDNRERNAMKEPVHMDLNPRLSSLLLGVIIHVSVQGSYHSFHTLSGDHQTVHFLWSSCLTFIHLAKSNEGCAKAASRRKLEVALIFSAIYLSAFHYFI